MGDYGSGFKACHLLIRGLQAICQSVNRQATDPQIAQNEGTDRSNVLMAKCGCIISPI